AEPVAVYARQSQVLTDQKQLKLTAFISSHSVNYIINDTHNEQLIYSTFFDLYFYPICIYAIDSPRRNTNHFYRRKLEDKSNGVD
ncbi:MAG: hypothetical protein AAFO82_20505, partial [Bacteroidota bacterium]